MSFFPREYIIKFLGSGDAFGCGGRFQTCIYVQAKSARFLLDCGASALIAMKRFGMDPSHIDFIFLSHLHGDHFDGIPYIIRETQILSKRTTPLIICGPQGLEERIRAAMENLFPGSSGEENFLLTFLELSDTEPNAVGLFIVQSYPVIHTPGTEPHALRIEDDGKVIAYTGDTEWTDALLQAADGADLFICECFTFEKKKNHLDYRTLKTHRKEINCHRLILTYMSDDMLARLPVIDFKWAEDGKRIVL